MKSLPKADLDLVAKYFQENDINLEKASFLISGMTGFVGSWLVESLMHLNKEFGLKIEITGITRNASKVNAWIDLASEKNVKIIESDIRVCKEIAGTFTHIVHAATPTTTATRGGDLDNVFERELKKDEFTENKEYIVSFVRNFNVYTLLREREHAMSVFSAESQTPPPELDVGLGLGESQGERFEQFPIGEELLSQKKLPTAKSKKHVMPLSSIRMEKEKEVAPNPPTSKKSKPKSLPVPLSIFKEPVEPVELGAAPKTSSQKPRVKGVAIPKLNLNPIEEDTPPQPLLLPTFQAKSGSKKLKPVSMGSTSVVAAAATPAITAPHPGGEEPEE